MKSLLFVAGAYQTGERASSAGQKAVSAYGEYVFATFAFFPLDTHGRNLLGTHWARAEEKKLGTHGGKMLGTQG